MANHVVDHWNRAYELVESASVFRLRKMFRRLTAGRQGVVFIRGCTRTLWAMLLKCEIEYRGRSPFSEN